MKISRTLIVFSWLIVLLAAIYAGYGLFWRGGGGPFPFTTLHGQVVTISGQGIYRYDTLLTAAGFRGTDAVTLFVGIPLLVFAILYYRRGSLRGALLLVSVLAYFLYNAASLAFSAAYNQLVLIYISAFSVGLFGFILACMVIDLSSLPVRVLPGMRERGTAVFLFFAGGATALIWLSDMLPALLAGSMPLVLGSYTTVFTYAFDLAVITPSAILAGIWLFRKTSLGYLLAPVMLVLCALIGLVVIGQSIFQLKAGIQFNPGQLIGLIGSWVVMGAIAIALTVSFFFHLTDRPVLGPIH